MSEHIYGSVKCERIPEYRLERREEIVRCRDCENYEPSLYRHFTCELLRLWVEQDDFCAWGEKR